MLEFTDIEKAIILKVAKDSIYHGLIHHRPVPINLAEYPQVLQNTLASFVCIKINKNLRGCIGSLTAHQPLIKDIAENAFAAAFSDPRFPMVTMNEFPKLEIRVSVLSKPEFIKFTSESDLLQQLRPGVDGLILQDLEFRGTFLPAVWEDLPTPSLFLQHLKLKAGLPSDYWSNTLTIQRYTTIDIP
jgi:AmmeMemoRadiSam system protein A